MSHLTSNSGSDRIAIVGMAGRFPGARSVKEFWRNIRDGVESISRFAEADLEVPNAKRLLADPAYVPARSILPEADLFDAAFFGIYPKEAVLMDPQHRIFLECCWEAFEDAGYDPQAYPGAVGVFAGCSANTYFLERLRQDPGFIGSYTGAYQVGNYPSMLGANADFLATRVSYKLNLRGPSFTMQAGCATSLLAVCQACESLLNYSSDMALAGGVSITFPQRRGYHYQEGGMVSPDGHCRTFDADARGTVFGSGAAVVLLKRLDDALTEGDHIYAVIRGCAVNNDGSAKVGYTAPSVEGQAAVIAAAHAVAGVDPESIGYVEAHGTGTPLGDPIEIAALTRAFRKHTQARNFCAVGTAKMNVGHLDIAAGATGLINAVNVLRHRVLPPAIHYQGPNPHIDFASSPFFVNTSLKEWEDGPDPRRAGVSAFGVGGTNAHVILEEAPQPPAPAAKSAHLLVLSARSEGALESATKNLADYLKSDFASDLASIAYTLQTGRRVFAHRRTLVCTDRADALRALDWTATNRLVSRAFDGNQLASVAFLFPGQGSQYPNMGLELYRTAARFRECIDHCAEILQPMLQMDIRSVMYPSGEHGGQAGQRLSQTLITQPALFAVEYALAQLWMSWGIRPRAMIGHSSGEFVAACIAGVFSLQDALGLVAARARLMQDLPGGSMLAVRLPEDQLRPLLNGNLDLAAVNGPNLSVAAGAPKAIGALEETLRPRGIAAKRLETSHAFHSRMMDPVIQPFLDRIKQVHLNAPRIPYLSGVTGKWIEAAEATDPVYWVRHFREAVRFSDGIQELRRSPDTILLEVGPGGALSRLALQHPGSNSQTVASSLADSSSATPDSVSMLNALGRLWLAGAAPDWNAVHGEEKPRRCPLPTYPFERQRYWMENVQDTKPATTTAAEESVAETRAAERPDSDRLDRIKSVVASMFEELSGMRLDVSAASTSFMEMGFDSLFLTQVSQALQTRFGLKITFRQLLDQQSTVDALAAHLDAALPASAFAEQMASQEEPPPAVNPLPAYMPAAPATAIEIIVKEQLQTMKELMARQLEALCGAGASVSWPAEPSREDRGPREFKAFGPYKPVQKGTTAELTDRQAKYLKALIERYTARTKGSKQFTQAHRRTLSDPRVVSGFRSQWKEMVYPIVTTRSQGSRLWDVDGNEYIDILNGFGPIFFGHAPRFVTEAVEQQLRAGFEIGPQTALAGEAADLICELTGMERATFCNTGSEAVMAALRVARTVTGRKKVVLFAGAYHGTFDEVLVKGIHRDGVPHSIPIAPGIPSENVENVTVLEYGTKGSLEYIRTHAGELAAVLAEPVQSRHPALQPREFLEELRRITAQAGAALIFDEVVTGFRIHPGGAQAVFGIRADLATYGKVLGGGLPVGVLAGSAAFMDALDGGMWNYGDDSFPEAGVTFFAGTFVRHPLAMAAVCAVLKHLKSSGPQLQQKLNAATEGLVRRLNEAFAERDAPIRIEHFGSIFYFSFPPEQRFGSLFYYHLREKGIHILEGFPCFLTTAHTDADIEQIVRAFRESVAEMQDGGVLPGPSRFADPAATRESLVREPGDHPTEAQREIWLSAQLGDDASCAFNESLSLRLNGQLNEAALRCALEQVVNRHEALRATFSADGEQLCFKDRITIDVPLIDLEALDSGRQDQCVREIVQKDAATPFDLVNGPLVRAALVRLGGESHILLFTVHHIVCDGWSTNVILEELSRIYSAECQGRRCELGEAMRFSAYAGMQAERLRTGEYAAIEAWWEEKFSAGAPALELPTDRPRPPVKSFSGATRRRTIGAESLQRIKRAGAQQGCTLFATLLGGFQMLLQRLTGQNEIVVGIPTAGQSLLEGDALVGHCVNFLPVRASFHDETTAGQFLRQVKTELLDAYEHQDYTYGSLVRKLSLPRDPSRLPLIEVQFNLEKVGAEMEFSGIRVEVEPNPKSFVNFDLFLNIVESENGLALDCDYNTDLFEDATIERWLGHFETLLESIAADSGRPAATLALLSAPERATLLREWNATEAEFPRDACIHHLFERQAARDPRATAVIFEETSLTYAEIDARSNQLAGYLRRLGAGQGTLVGIYLDRSLEMMVSLLGILKAGAAYVPLDPSYPRERLSFITQDAGAAFVLTQERLAMSLGSIDARVICLDQDWKLVARESRTAPAAAVSADDLAYVIYTSGSTGRPKGVALSHRAVVNLLCSMQRKPGMTAKDTLVAVTTLAFDIAALELFLPLISGARVVIAPREVAMDGAQLARLMAVSGVTIFQATPATFRLLLEAGWKGSPGLKILCGGEALPRDLADSLLGCCDSLWNMYGPTETAIWSGVIRVEPGRGAAPIGRPIANTQFYVLDASGEPVPIGVAGELHIGGDGVARGYWNQPELTSKRFIEDPFRATAGARLYKTGDLVRYRADGALEFLGRVDNQVKIRGFRIELGEIEAVLSRYPGMGECTVIAREEPNGDKRLAAYFVAGAEPPCPSDLRAFVTASLPDYMAPSVFVPVERLPRTPNGKIDRRSLPAPDAVEIRRHKTRGAPTGRRELELIKICSEVLHIASIDVEDNLFDLGADSIHLFQISARAVNAGIRVTPRDVLRGRSIAAILDALDKDREEEAMPQGPRLAPVLRSNRRLRDPAV